MREPMRPTSKSICEAADRTGARMARCDGRRAVPRGREGVRGRGVVPVSMQSIENARFWKRK